MVFCLPRIDSDEQEKLTTNRIFILTLALFWNGAEILKQKKFVIVQKDFKGQRVSFT